jgi:8-oxo-dGTP diphosphatase
MPHIHTGPGEHDLTTTAFIVRIESNIAYGLLHQHKKLERLLPVGGHVELTENPWAAVIHEIQEESGYDVNQLKVLQPKDRIKRMDGVKVHPVPLFLQTHGYKADSDHAHVDIGFAFVTNELPNSRPAQGEQDVLIWLSAEEIQAQKNHMPADIAQIYQYVFETALLQWEQVDPESFDA